MAALQLVILNGMNTIGRVIPNALVPHLGVYNVMIFCMTSLGILILFMPLVTTIPATVMFAILYGFFSGAYVSADAGLLSPVITALAKKDQEIGTRIGLCFAFT
ncbi:hypothetical protein H0H93_013902, partial [Arthromyces matolae]